MTTFWPGVFIDFHCFLKTLESDHLRHDVVSLCTVCVTPITVYEELLVTAWNYTHIRNLEIQAINSLPKDSLGGHLRAV